MLDRNVKIMFVSHDYPNIKVDEEKPFSHYEHVRNIILLGDPGSGKTELMKYASKMFGGHFTRAISFTNRQLPDSEKYYFVDALDESRSAENNRDFTHKIIERLWGATPDKFRLSSRQRDWHDDYDLHLFRGYFDENGGYIVVRLLPLIEEEMMQILRIKGIASPESFLLNAREKKLGELLNNPQNMIMLATAIKGGIWPSTRKEVFEIATQQLLEEHNTNNLIINDSANYSINDLKNAAGELFALRLLANIPGFRLYHDANDVDIQGLYYRDVNTEGQEKFKATLHRRIFQSTEESGCLDYAHRTVAEFMAGQWLASKLDSGFPAGRLNALIGRDGFPVTELRGVYAWLPVFITGSPEYFLSADPLGVITNGDVFSLPVSSKRSLLHSLSDYANQTPWFDTWGEMVTQLKAFGVLPLKEDILTLLGKSTTSPTMRITLLQMLTPELAAEEDVRALCQEIVSDSESRFNEAGVAIDVLLSDWHRNQVWLITYLRDDAVSPERIGLRADILSNMPASELTVSDLIKLITDVLNLPHELPLGWLWALKVKIPSNITFEFFRSLLDIVIDNNIRRINKHQVLDLIKDWVANTLECQIIQRSEEIMICLELLGSINSDVSYTKKEKDKLRSIISPYKGMIIEHVRRKIISEQDKKKDFYPYLFDVRINSQGVFAVQDKLEILINYLESQPEFNEKIGRVYQTALKIADCDGEEFIEDYDRLLDMGSRSSEWGKIQSENAFCTIENYYIENASSRKLALDKFIDEKKQLNKRIEANRYSISLGYEWDEMIEAAKIYWGRVRYAREIDIPHDRLSYFMSDENISIIKSGWLAVLNDSNAPSADEIISLYLENEKSPKDYVILAASEIYCQRNSSLSGLSEGVISSLCVLVLTTDIQKSEDKGARFSPYPLSLWPLAKANYPKLIAETYLKTLDKVKHTGNQGHQYIIDKIVNLMISPEFADYRINYLKVLTSDVGNSKKLIWITLRDSSNHQLLNQCIDFVLDNGDNISLEVRDLWSAVRFIVQPGKEDNLFIGSLSSRPALAFILRDLVGLGRYGNKQHTRIQPQQTERIITTLITVFPERKKPMSHILVTERKSEEEEESEELILRLISSLAADITSTASDCLTRLVAVDHKNQYYDALRQARQVQITRRREAEYSQPEWIQVRDALQNKQPANAADLHALICASLKQLTKEIERKNTDIWKFFWNENGNGAVCNPKSENSGTNVLITLMRFILHSFNIRLEPEGHMANDKRADIAITYLDRLKILTEVKRDYHPDIWTAVDNQLQKFYTTDPESDGYGIFFVFWFGKKRTGNIPLHPARQQRPQTASEMTHWLNEDVANESRSKITCFVLDVSGE